MFGALEANLKRMDIPLDEISHGYATHYHMDHAGAAQDLKRAAMRLVVFDLQAPFIAPMAKWMKRPIFFRSFLAIQASGSKLRTSAAIRQSIALVKHCVKARLK